jgi:hypothetical protein
MLCSWMFSFLLCICFVYVVHVISCFKLKSEWEREWGSIVSLSKPGDSCKLCSWIHPQGVCWWRLRWFNSCSHSPRIGSGVLKQCNDCTGWSRSLSCESEQRKSKTAATRVRRVEGIQHLGVVAWLSWGARANPSEIIKVENLRRNRPLNLLKAKCREDAVGSRRKVS